MYSKEIESQKIESLKVWKFESLKVWKFESLKVWKFESEKIESERLKVKDWKWKDWKFESEKYENEEFESCKFKIEAKVKSLKEYHESWIREDVERLIIQLAWWLWIVNDLCINDHEYDNRERMCSVITNRRSLIHSVFI